MVGLPWALSSPPCLCPSYRRGLLSQVIKRYVWGLQQRWNMFDGEKWGDRARRRGPRWQNG